MKFKEGDYIRFWALRFQKHVTARVTKCDDRDSWSCYTVDYIHPTDGLYRNARISDARSALATDVQILEAKLLYGL